jgi:hypothetical protein
MTAPLHACGRCHSHWTGLNTAHCNSCHLTFTGVSAFDEHRYNGTCRPITETRLIDRERNGVVMYGWESSDSEDWVQARQDD